jgi:hypothetical protein
MLFDLKNDPDELHDLGDDPAYDAIFDKMYDRLLAWALRPSQRTTRSADQLIKMRTGSKRKGVVLGIYDETEIDPELVDKYLP